MPDLHSPNGPMDPGRVHAQDPLDVAYWCNQFHCTEAQLKAAVDAVGEHVTELRRHLAAPLQQARAQHRH